MEARTYIFREKDVVVFETAHAFVFVPRQPHTHAVNGGHLVVAVKRNKESDRTKKITHMFELTAEERLEVMALMAACSELMVDKLGAIICNIQQNGNWYYRDNPSGSLPGSSFHVHCYGRSDKEEDYTFFLARQRFGQALEFNDPAYPSAENSWLRFVQPYADEQIDLITDELPARYKKYITA